jgi:ABC-type bacteriocin/lantibiotic exporter with double-glycine peptidase domain
MRSSSRPSAPSSPTQRASPLRTGAYVCYRLLAVCTLTILRPYRLNTIMDSDKVLVMDNGVAAEYDTPQNLLADESSMFYALVSNWENSR